MPFYEGLDWGGIAHAVYVVDGTGQIVARIEARHDNAGLVDMLARLRKIALPTELPIAIERPSGLVVDALIKAGHPVTPIHPNVVKACRPAIARRAANPTRATLTCWPMSCAPTATVSAL